MGLFEGVLSGGRGRPLFCSAILVRAARAAANLVDVDACDVVVSADEIHAPFLGSPTFLWEGLYAPTQSVPIVLVIVLFHSIERIRVRF
jgi:hypothetical protein